MQSWGMTIPSRAIPKDKWGQDHWRLLLQIEERCVFSGGELDLSNLRCNKERHPENWTEFCPLDDLPIRLRDNTLFDMPHDDWDIIKDFAVHNLLETTGEFKVGLLDEGWRLAHKLRRHLANGGYYTDFDPV